MSKDYYAILGVSRGASADEVKKSFRRLAHEHHPDKGGDPAKFKDVNEAYQVLSDEKKRGAYDQFGSAAFEQGMGGDQGFSGFDFGSAFGGQGVEFGDLGNIFGEMFGMGQQTSRSSRGRDIEMDIQLTFREAAFGVTRTITLHRSSLCDHCHGQGAEPGSKLSSCKACNGSGAIKRMQRTIFGSVQTTTACETCYGQGKLPETMCKSCKGLGAVKRDVKMDVPIPAGMSTGEALKLTGQGEHPAHGGRAGDLYVRITVKQDSRFVREGHDVVTTMNVPFSLLALGGSVEIETMDGKRKQTISGGTPSGAVITIRGEGIAYARGGRGNLRVTLVADIPKKLTREQRRLIEEWQREGL